MRMSPNLYMSKERQEQIRQNAENVIVNCRIGKVPVDVYQIATLLGFKVVKMCNDELSGAVDKAKKIIFVNNNDTETRQKFTIAHELGHYILNHGDVVDYRIKSHNDEGKECEADEFAGNVLMPKPWLIYFINNRANDDKALATIFGTSTEAIKFRKLSIF